MDIHFVQVDPFHRLGCALLIRAYNLTAVNRLPWACHVSHERLQAGPGGGIGAGEGMGRGERARQASQRGKGLELSHEDQGRVALTLDRQGASCGKGPSSAPAHGSSSCDTVGHASKSVCPRSCKYWNSGEFWRGKG